MAAYVGAQYSAEELWHYFRLYDEVDPDEEAQLRPLAARIRAFDVPVLRDVTFTMSRLRDYDTALRTLLRERLLGIAWAHVDEFGGVGPILKYNLIHEVVAAPADEATGEPMVLELYGHLTLVNKQPVQIGQFRDFLRGHSTHTDEAVLGELTFHLERATYANTRWPGIGVPFYL